MRIKMNLFIIYFIVGARCMCPYKGQTHGFAQAGARFIAALQ